MALPNSITSANQIVLATGVSSALSQIYLYDPSVALQADPAAPEKILRDCTIAGAYDHLQRSVVGSSLAYAPRDPKNKKHRALASIQEDLTRETDSLSQSLFNLSRATFMGAAWALMVPERRLLTIGDGKPRWWTVIARVRDIDKRRFRIVRDLTPDPEPSRYALSPEPDAGAALSPSGTTGTLNPSVGSWRWEMYRAPGFRWEPLALVAPADRWIQHVPDTSERGLAYGFGQSDTVYEFFWIKQQILRIWVQGIERWGQGFLYAQIDNLAQYAKARGVSLQQALAQTVQQMRTWRSENLAAVDKGTELKLLDMPTAGNEACLTGVQYLDREIVKFILSALQPTGGGDDTGGYSSSKVEEGSTDNTVAYLRSPLEERWTATFARFLVEHNQDNLAELGLDKIRAQPLQLKGKEVRDVKTMLEVFQFCAANGIPVRRSELYEALQLTAPNGDEEDGDVLTFPKPVMGAGLDSPGADLDSEPGLRRPVGSGRSAVADEPARNGTARAVA